MELPAPAPFAPAVVAEAVWRQLPALAPFEACMALWSAVTARLTSVDAGAVRARVEPRLAECSAQDLANLVFCSTVLQEAPWAARRVPRGCGSAEVGALARGHPTALARPLLALAARRARGFSRQSLGLVCWAVAAAAPGEKLPARELRIVARALARSPLSVDHAHLAAALVSFWARGARTVGFDVAVRPLRVPRASGLLPRIQAFWFGRFRQSSILRL